MDADDPAAALCIYVPGVPVGWQRSGGNGKRRYTEPKTRAKEAEIAAYATCALIGRQPFTGAVRVEIIAWMPVPESWSAKKKAMAIEGKIRPTAKPDGDNVLKLALDALNGVAWKDDAAVVDMACSKRFGVPVQTVIIVEPA
jgi:Holliday junction resolvase RusA-like endonuclease